MSLVNLLRSVRLPLVLASVSLLLGLSLLEVFLRVTHLQPDFFWQLDAEVGAIHIPAKKGWVVFRGGRQYIEINSLGYRDRERSARKSPGTFRVALLGDSFVEAFQVGQAETLAAILERRLNAECGAAPATSFEVLNFGVSGFGTAEELETLRYRASEFAPDLVLLNLYTSNDLYDNSHELDVEPDRLHYVLGPDGELQRLPFTVRDNAVKRWLRAHSYAYLFVRDRIKLSRARSIASATALSMPTGDAGRQPRSRATLAGVQYLRQLPPAVTRAWQLTAALIAEIEAEANRQSARFGIVVIPNREEIETRGSRSDADSTNDYQQSLAKVDHICRELRTDCLQLADVFRGAPVDESYFPLDGHWTPKGHARAAAATFEWMRRSGLVPCASRSQNVQALGPTTRRPAATP